MVKQRHYLTFKKLSDIYLSLKLTDKSVPNYFFQIFPTKFEIEYKIVQNSQLNSKFEMSNEQELPNLIDSNKSETNSLENNTNQSKKRHKYTKEERKQDRKARLALKQEKKAVGFHDNDTLKQTQYYFENDLRKVYPYFFGWNTTAKERWFVYCDQIGLLNIDPYKSSNFLFRFKRSLLDIYKNEFNRAIANQSVEKLITEGKIRVKPFQSKIFYYC